MIVIASIVLFVYLIGMGLTVLVLVYDVTESETLDVESFDLIDDYEDNGSFVICLLWPITLWFIALHVMYIKILQFIERNRKDDKR